MARSFLNRQPDRSLMLRHCHNLSYQSVQEAHRYDGVYEELAAGMGVSVEEIKESLKEVYGGYEKVALEMLRGVNA